jgi:hypothetical protein
MYLPQIVWLEFDYMNEHYEAEAIPAFYNVSNSVMPAYEIYFNNEYNGTIVQQNNGWLNNLMEEGLSKVIGRKLSTFLNTELSHF